MLRGPVCVLPESRRLRLWVQAPPGAEITLDGRTPAHPPVLVAGGLRFDLDAVPGARETVVEARHGGESWTFLLALEESRRPDWFTEAWTLGEAGNLAAARSRVEPWLASPVAAERGLALTIAALVDLGSGRGERAEEELRQAIVAHRQSGLLSGEVLHAAALGHRLIQRRDFAEARAVLEHLPDPAGHASSLYQQAYTRGLLASKVGDLRTGLRLLRQAVDHAARAGTAEDQVAGGQVLARELQWVGRTTEAELLFAQLDGTTGEDLSVCLRGQLHSNHAWARLLAREAGVPVQDPKPLLRQVLRVFDQECAGFPDRQQERVNVRVNLALAHLHDGDTDLARTWLEAARQLLAQPDLSLLLWWQDVEARIHLAAGEFRRALAAYEDLGMRARASLSLEAEWRAAYGKARALESLGKTLGALAAYAEAEALLEQESRLVAMHEGRDTFVAQREEATRRHLDLLLARGHNIEALRVVRQARSRFLRSLRRFVRLGNLSPEQRGAWDRAVAAHSAQRDEVDRAAAELWRLPSGDLTRAMEARVVRLAELRSDIDVLLAQLDGETRLGSEPLPQLSSGEVLLAYHPLPDGWVGFAADDQGVIARRLGHLEDVLEQPGALAAQVLAPFAPPIRRAQQVRVLPYGALRDVEFHTLPFGDEPLLAERSVVYALDLPHPAAPPRVQRALLVGDPEGNLPGARAEVDRVERALRSARPSWSVYELAGRRATGAALRPLLAESALFHYAGHAVFSGWDSFLPLAGEGRLTVDDILALPRSPEWVVLSGCETGATLEESAVESIGLAHAFLSAGASTVIAAVQPVSDREALALVNAFYADLPRATSPSEALRLAQLAVWRTGADGAWQNFRAFVP